MKAMRTKRGMLLKTTLLAGAFSATALAAVDSKTRAVVASFAALIAKVQSRPINSHPDK